MARIVLALIAFVLGYYGFRFVTQAGQGIGTFQNDGYGATGGIMILISGFTLGIIMGRNNKK